MSLVLYHSHRYPLFASDMEMDMNMVEWVRDDCPALPAVVKGQIAGRSEV